MKNAGFIGCGNMGGVLAAAAAKSGAEVFGADLDASKLERLQTEHGVTPATAEEIAKTCDFIFLGVKPQVMRAATAQIREILAARQAPFVVVTMAAGLAIATIRDFLGDCPIIRIMPNTPAAVGEGMILYCPGDGVTAADEAAFLEILGPAGRLQKLEERKIDAACALSGCGPAFVCMFVEALVDGGVRCGLSRDQAKLFALQTVLGTAKLALDTGKDPAQLRGDVCSPAGSTIEGVVALEQGGLRAAVLDAVQAAYLRTLELK